MLAGVSADYYARLEQGRDRHPSAEVLAALGRVLTLDEDALVHLRQLAAAAPASSRVLAGTRPVGSGVLQLLSQWEHTPAFVLDPFRDVLACTPLAAALHPGLCQRPNMIRLMFLDETEQAMHPNWERSARDAVAALRASAGPYMDDPRLASLVGELVLENTEFARMWARQDVRTKTAGSKDLLHPIVGALTVQYETFEITASPGHNLVVYHVDPSSPDAEALSRLADHVTSRSSASGNGQTLVFSSTQAH